MLTECPFCGCQTSIPWQQVLAAILALLLKLLGGAVPALPADGTCPCCGGCAAGKGESNAARS
jgi:hypothetical protein